MHADRDRTSHTATIPGAEIVQKVWQDKDNPFAHDRHMILLAAAGAWSRGTRTPNFNVYADNRALLLATT